MSLPFFQQFRFVKWFVSAFIRKYFVFIGLGFFAGLVLSTIVTFLPTISPSQFVNRENVIGLVGQYSLSDLPRTLQNQLSMGLTIITANDEVKPAAASSWEVKNNGASYIFHLRQDLFWQDGSKFRSFDINLRLKDVEILARGDYDVEFKLKGPYSALPSVVSQPLFKKGFLTLGTNKSARIMQTNGKVSSLEITDNKAGTKTLYKFYTTLGEAVLALKLHQINTITGLPSLTGMQNWATLKISKETDYHKFVALFFNNDKEPYKEKNTRLGLTYSLPNNFIDEEVALGPISKKSWAYNPQLKNYLNNSDLANKYLKDLLTPTASASALSLTLISMPGYRDVADKIAKAWNDFGIKVKVQENNSNPKDYDVFLGAIETMPDPDEYSLWHSTQEGNISQLNNPRIDKLLEDGRITTDFNQRKQIYQDFQRFLVEDDPAAFLFYPSNYTVSRL